jgi:antirestriction protein ArdC
MLFIYHPLKDHNVFNIQQTTFPEKKPEEWISLKQKFAVPEINDDYGMYKSPELDRMLNEHSWICPVNIKEGNRAFYAPGVDEVTVPLKAQFKDGESFYTTLLHEMAHSTGTESRLNREKGGYFGDAKYAREELVAELTSAVCSQSLGISSHIREENAKYLKSWLEALNKEPKFILTILSDVNKASQMINEAVLEQEKSLKTEQQPHNQKTQIQNLELINRKFDSELELQ